MSNASTGNTIPVPGEDRSDWERVRALNDADIAHDDDNPRTRAADWAGATLKQGGVPLGKVRRRGPGKKSPRVLTTLRLPPEVLARWKATGPGWQTRMAEVLAQRAP